MRLGAIVTLSACLGIAVSGCYRGGPGTGFGAGTDSVGTDSADGDDGMDDGPIEDPPENVDIVPVAVSRRLSQAELDNTLADLMEDTTRPARTYLSEDEYAPYDNDYELQLASRTLIESMEVLAIDVANRLVDDPTRRALVVPCEPAASDDEACFRQFVESFGRLALRRPLIEQEIAGYMALQEFSVESVPGVDNGFYTGVALAISAMLQDPEFLYRIEAGTPTTEDGVFKLDDYEIAARISFLLWGSAPDDALLGDAEAGRLIDPQTRRDAVERVLDSDKARAQVNRYHAMWLGYRAIPHEQTLIDAFDRETTALIDGVVFEDQSDYSNLFTSDVTYLDTDLANHYGLTPPPGGQGWVTYDEGRAGILSHGSVLAAFSKFTDTSPTQRGIFISERLLCAEIPAPPPTVDADNPPGNPDDPTACKEDRYAAHREIESCANCHNLMDPIGMGLENYDIAGRYRATDDGKPQCTISGQGELPGVGTFSGPAELAERLIESGELERCVTQHYLQFALGREPSPDDAPLLDHVFEGFEASDYDFRAMLADYAADEAFGFRREPAQ